jgi:hypothetical protein
VGKHVDHVHESEILDLHVLAEESLFQAAPLANFTLPANNGFLDYRALLYAGTRQNRAVNQLNTALNVAIFADDHVRANLSACLNCSSFVDNGVTLALLAELSLALDVPRLSNQVVSGLTNVHPESFKLELEDFAITRHLREDFTLN